MARVLIIADTHCPGMRRGYIDFLKRVADNYSITRVVHIGDLVDWASISFHEKSPALNNAVRDFDVAKRQVASLARAFPNADWMIGNHDALSERQAISVGLPPQLLRDYADVWEVDWTVHPRFSKLTIDGVLYSHRHAEHAKLGVGPPLHARLTVEVPDHGGTKVVLGLFERRVLTATAGAEST